MKRLLTKTWFWLLLLALLAATLYVFPGSRWRIIGWAKGESFYKGRPTSYWREQIQLRRLHFLESDQGLTLLSWQRLQRWLGAEDKRQLPPFLMRYEIDLRLRHAPYREADPAALAVLMELLSDADREVVEYAYDVLGQLGKDAEAAVPVLLKQLDHVEPLRRYWAAIALYRIQPDHRRLVPVLVQLLEEPMPWEEALWDHRVTTVRVLGLIGPPAKPAFCLLLELWHSDRASYDIDGNDGFNALGRALRQIDPEAAAAAAVDEELVVPFPFRIPSKR